MAMMVLWFTAFFVEICRSANPVSAVGIAGVTILPGLFFLACLSFASPALLKYGLRRGSKQAAVPLRAREVEEAPPPKRRKRRVVD